MYFFSIVVSVLAMLANIVFILSPERLRHDPGFYRQALLFLSQNGLRDVSLDKWMFVLIPLWILSTVLGLTWIILVTMNQF